MELEKEDPNLQIPSVGTVSKSPIITEADEIIIEEIDSDSIFGGDEIDEEVEVLDEEDDEQDTLADETSTELPSE